jgi:hypothetical protein
LSAELLSVWAEAVDARRERGRRMLISIGERGVAFFFF